MLVCANCGRENRDPLVDVTGWTCGYCHHGPLLRIADPAQAPQNPPNPGPDPGRIVAAGALGATVGGVFLGPIGAVAGGLIGAFIGAKQ